MNNYKINQIKWAKLTIFEQMANIGSEVGRAFNARKNHHHDRLPAAIDRAIDLFDATAIVLAAKKSPQLKEVLRAKEEFLTLFFKGAPPLLTQPSVIENYFLQYALAARHRH
jgi:hypothetical protein